MKYRTRTFYTDSQKALMWERWKECAALQQIAKRFDRAHTSVQKILGASVRLVGSVQWGDTAPKRR